MRFDNVKAPVIGKEIGGRKGEAKNWTGLGNCYRCFYKRIKANEYLEHVHGISK